MTVNFWERSPYCEQYEQKTVIATEPVVFVTKKNITYIQFESTSGLHTIQADKVLSIVNEQGEK